MVSLSWIFWCVFDLRLWLYMFWNRFHTSSSHAYSHPARQQGVDTMMKDPWPPLTPLTPLTHNDNLHNLQQNHPRQFAKNKDDSKDKFQILNKIIPKNNLQKNCQKRLSGITICKICKKKKKVVRNNNLQKNKKNCKNVVWNKNLQTNWRKKWQTLRKISVTLNCKKLFAISIYVFFFFLQIC